MIALENACKRYQTPNGVKVILDNVNLKVARGRGLGLLGRNGAGKSTLLKIISGVIPLDRGRVERTGEFSWPLGFAGSFHGALTGAQNAEFVARLYGYPLEEVREYVEDFAELGDFFHAPFRTYSSGMRARLAFGVSMAVRFDVYLIDEITAVGDSQFRAKCKQVFEKKLADSDVIMVSHSESTIREYCKACAVLENGQLTYFEDVEEGLKRHRENMKA